MGDAGRELAERGHLLGLHQLLLGHGQLSQGRLGLLLGLPQFRLRLLEDGDIVTLGHNESDLAVLIGDRCYAKIDDMFVAVGRGVGRQELHGLSIGGLFHRPPQPSLEIRIVCPPWTVPEGSSHNVLSADVNHG